MKEGFTLFEVGFGLFRCAEIGVLPKGIALIGNDGGAIHFPHGVEGFYAGFLLGCPGEFLRFFEKEIRALDGGLGYGVDILQTHEIEPEMFGKIPPGEADVLGPEFFPDRVILFELWRGLGPGGGGGVPVIEKRLDIKDGVPEELGEHPEIGPLAPVGDALAIVVLYVVFYAPLQGFLLKVGEEAGDGVAASIDIVIPTEIGGYLGPLLGETLHFIAKYGVIPAGEFVGDERDDGRVKGGVCGGGEDFEVGEQPEEFAGVLLQHFGGDFACPEIVVVGDIF